MMTTVYKLTQTEIKRLLPYGCKDINCCVCPFRDNKDICNELMYLLELKRRL